MRSCGRALIVALVLLLTTTGADGQAPPAADVYKDALAREGALRRDLDGHPADGAAEPLLSRIRAVVREYEECARTFPASGYSDNALWQGAVLAADAFWQFGEVGDRKTALRLFRALTGRFPTSSRVKLVPAQIERLENATVSAPPAPPASAATRTTAAGPRPAATGTPAAPAPASAAPAISGRAATVPATLQAIRREVLPDAVRVTLELERETPFVDQRLDGPPRVFIELQNTLARDMLKDARLSFADDVVRQIRVGRPQQGRIRVVLDLQGAGRHSVYALYNPYRVVVDFERPASKDTKATLAADAKDASLPPKAALSATAPGASWTPAAGREPGAAPPIIARADAPRLSIAPAADAKDSPGSDVAPGPPAANAGGGLSLSRQLGLGIARIVIDPGHGGRDPGAKIKGATEAEIVLDVALRLEKLLKKQPGVEVLLTRRTNGYIALEERTASANRAGADLFLSIHANASANPGARGVETYFLNFAPDPAAEAIAARENAGSSRTMRNLPDIVRSIALNNKIDESRDFAAIVQASLYERLRKANREARNLGVKQAPFMVLIGATMPSILAEISFITNRQEGSLLKTDKYRQQIADALFAGVMGYQQSLKRVPAVAVQ